MHCMAMHGIAAPLLCIMFFAQHRYIAFHLKNVVIPWGNPLGWPPVGWVNGLKMWLLKIKITKYLFLITEFYF